MYSAKQKVIRLLHFDFPAKLGGQKVCLMHGALFKGDLIKFCEIFTKITLELPPNSQMPLLKCKKLVINTTKCHLCLFRHKIYCKMVSNSEILKILWELAFRWAKFCEIVSHTVRYSMYA